MNISKHGTNQCGNAPYPCKACGAYLVLTLQTGYSAEQKAQVRAGDQARMRLRGAHRMCQVWRQTIMKWLIPPVEQLPPLLEALLMAQADDILEFDEVGSCVERRDTQRWWWTVLCRRSDVSATLGGDPPSYRA